MNWYKKSGKYEGVPFIRIAYYNQTYNELAVYYSNKGPYVYPNVSPYQYNLIANLIRRKNYRAAKKTLDTFSLSKKPRPETPEQKEEILKEMEERGLW